eukprot:TRINITY_DN57999_c0_g1_i1.p2 TRINITY_DN57999_c0_g1~~TRINITY_DN57999_c0_g1_i1.p2  ORF type:complete len:180 (-),score=103.18 TRINITY_DN57999_c0_g1_i1:43-582(-)
MQRSMLAKDLKRTLEFIVETEPTEETKQMAESQKPFEFSISPDSLQNVRKQARHKIPDFLFEGQLDTTFCDIAKPLQGTITIRKCAVDIKSIELQLVRVETCSYMEGEAREATEIQNIQIADGNVTHDLTLPIYMVFPRLFTCSTTKSKAFKIEFELNLILVFVDSHMVTENFSLVLHR